MIPVNITDNLVFSRKSVETQSHLTFDPSQTTAAALRLTEALAIASAVFSRCTQLMQLTLLLFIDFFDAGGFEDGMPSLRWVRMKEGAIIQIHSAEVDFILGDVIDSQPFSLFGHLGTIFGKLPQEKRYSHDYDDVWI